MARKIVGSLVASLAGIIAGACVTVGMMGAWSTPAWLGPALFFTAWCALPFWLLLVLPLYLVVPRTSILWRPPISAALGAFAGAGVLVAYGAVAWPDWGPAELLLPIAALVGGVTAFAASITAPYFCDGNRRSNAKA